MDEKFLYCPYCEQILWIPSGDFIQFERNIFASHKGHKLLSVSVDWSSEVTASNSNDPSQNSYFEAKAGPYIFVIKRQIIEHGKNISFSVLHGKLARALTVSTLMIDRISKTLPAYFYPEPSREAKVRKFIDLFGDFVSQILTEDLVVFPMQMPNPLEKIAGLGKEAINEFCRKLEGSFDKREILSLTRYIIEESRFQGALNLLCKIRFRIASDLDSVKEKAENPLENLLFLKKTRR